MMLLKKPIFQEIQMRMYNIGVVKIHNHLTQSTTSLMPCLLLLIHTY